MRKDLRMVQPFVRVHTVQVQSGEYANIAEGSDSAPLRAAPKDTKVCSVPMRATLCAYVWMQICPVSTRTECPVWDESLELDGSASQLIRPSVVLLFELLDIPLAIALPETQVSFADVFTSAVCSSARLLDRALRGLVGECSPGHSCAPFKQTEFLRSHS
jgi:hypothetical protein